MDELFVTTLEQIALQGQEGCSLGRLFELLTGTPAAEKCPITNGVKQALWGLLLEVPDDISFCIPGEPAAEKGKKRPRKEKKGEEGDEEQGGQQGQQQQEEAAQNAKVLKQGMAELGSLAAAEQHGVHVVASKDLQDSAIGLYDVLLAKHQPSLVQRKALGLVGAAGPRGVMQNELCAQLGQDNRSFFHVVKNLEQRGLLVKRGATVRTDKGSTYFSKGKVQTNLLRLARFAPNEDKDIKYMEISSVSYHQLLASAQQQQGATGKGAGGEVPLATLNDMAHYRRICAQLRGLEGHTARESELKVLLGFQGTVGHRAWRRIKLNMIKRGLLEEFAAMVGDKTVKVVRMLKDAAEERGSEESSEGEGEEEEAGEGMGVLGAQVAELSLDRQLFKAIIGAGSEGLTSVELDRRLMFNCKRGGPRLKELERRFDLHAQLINQGRAAIIRYTATEPLLRQFQGSIAPLHPIGGWLGAVQDAIEAGLEADEPFPTLGLLAGVEPLPAAQALPLAPALGLVLPAAMEVDGAGESAGLAAPGPAPSILAGIEGAAAAAAPPPAAEGAEGGAEDKAAPGEALLAPPHLILVSEPIQRPSLVAGGGSGGGGSGSQRLHTLVQSKRVQWLLELVEACGFALVSALPRFFKECDEREGVQMSTQPDRKTVNRIIDRAQATGRVQSMQVALPTTNGGLQTRSHTLVVRPGIEQGPEFIDLVYKAYRAFARKRRTDANGLANMQKLQGKPIPEVQLQPLLPPKPGTEAEPAATTAEAGAAPQAQDARAAAPFDLGGQGYMDMRASVNIRKMLANGYQMAKAQRLKALHHVALCLVGLAAPPGQERSPPTPLQQQGEGEAGQEEAPTAQQPPAAAAASGQPAAAAVAERGEHQGAADFLISAVAGEGLAPSRLDVQTMSANDPRKKLIVTSQQLWDGLTVQQYVQVVGSTHPDPEWVRQLAATGKLMVELSGEDRKQLYGLEPLYNDRPIMRLSHMLDLLGRMGLLASVVPVGPRARFGVGGVGATTFVVRDKVEFQEPVPQLAGVGAGLAPAPAQRVNHTFDMSTNEGYATYWARLQYVVVSSNKPGARLSPTDPIRQCFPFDRAPEVAYDKSWSTKHAMTTQQCGALQAALVRAGDPQFLTAEGCWDMAKTLGIDYENVLLFVRERRVRARKERLGGAKMVPKMAAGASAGPGSGAAPGRPAVPSLPPTEEQVEARRKHREGKRQRNLQTLRHRIKGEGVSESAVPPAPPEALLARKRSRPGSGVGVKPGVDVHKAKAERLAKQEEERRQLQAAAAAAGVGEAVARAAGLAWPLLPAEPETAAGAAQDALAREAEPELESEVEEAEEEPVRVDRAALMTMPMPLRKKKWHLYEDRQLLCAWAGWLAKHGRERTLLWRCLKGRPAYKSSTLRHRLRELLRHDVIGPKLERVSEVAASVYERRILREAEEIRAQQAAAATAAPGGEAVCAASQASPPAKRAAGEEAGGAGEGERRPAKKPRRGEPVEREVDGVGMEAMESADAALEVLAPLFPTKVAEDFHALQEVAALIEEVGAIAPKRFKHPQQAAVLSLPRALGVSGGKRPGPKPGFRQLRSEVASLASKAPTVRSLLRQWAVRARDALPSGARPSPAIASLAELIKSLLLAGAERSMLGAGPQRALVERFSQEQIMEAFGLLHRQGLINPGGARSSAMQLSDRFRAKLQVLGLPPGAITEAAACKQLLREQRQLDIQPADPDDASVDILSGATVAAALELMAQGEARLAPHGVTATPEVPGSAALAGQARQAELQQHASRLAVSIPVRITLEGPPAENLWQPGRPREEQQAALRATATRGSAEPVLYQPSLVASSEAVRQEAAAAAAEAFAAAAPQGAAAPGVLAGVLHAVRESGADGVAEQDVRKLVGDLLEKEGGTAGAAAAQLAEEAAAVAVGVLCRYGLVRRVSRWDSASLVAAEHSQRLLTYPEPPAPGTPGALGEQIGGLLASANLPPQGQSQPCIDRPIRPWLDHRGQLNESMWLGLVKRATSVVLRHPGIPEKLLILELGAISPFYANELLAMLVDNGVLRVHTVAARGAGGGGGGKGGGGALAACFGWAGPAHADMLRCYFLTPASIA